MTTSGSGNRPVFASQPLVVTPEVLNAEQRRSAEDYLHRTGQPGLFVGALVSSSQTWAVKPLTLDRGVLKVVRYTDPRLKLDEERFEQCRALLERVQKVVPHVVVGESGNQLWQCRHFHQRTLAEYPRLNEEQLEVHPFDFALELVRFMLEAKDLGIIHGHLCLQNIAAENRAPVVMDFGFRQSSPVAAAQSAEAAPEVRRGERPSFAADIYGVGRVLQVLLAEFLSEEQRRLIAAMQDFDPMRRPQLDAAGEILFPGAILQRGYIVPAAQKAELKLGRVLGTNLEVEREEREQKGQSEPGQQPLSPGAEVKTERSVAEAIEWLQGTAMLSSDVVQKIRESMSEEEETYASEESEAQAAAPPPPAPAAPRADRAPKNPEPGGGSQLVWSLLLWIIAAAILGLVIKYAFLSGGGGPVVQPNVPYERYWASNLPSRMREVAVAAAVQGDERAELVIVQDVMGGAERRGVRADLLRLAFDARWESQLLKKDRETALKLSLSELLRGAVRDIADLNEVHPGVLFAVLASIAPDAEVPSLSLVPVSRLAALPAPLGAVFGELTNLKADNCADPAVRALAKILNGDTSADTLRRFLGESQDWVSARRRLRLLLDLKQPEVPPAQAFEAITAAGGGALKELAGWFDGTTLAQWEDPAAKALLIAGKLPPAPLPAENAADLLRFPVLETRAEGQRLLNEKLAGKDLQHVVAVLAGQGNNLSRDQTIALLAALSTEKNKQYPLLEKWFSVRPDVPTTLELLIARGSVKGDDPFSITAAGYLKDKEWPATESNLKKLIRHQEALARVLAYAKLDANDPKHVPILRVCAVREPLESLRQQLRAKLEDVGVAVAPGAPGR